MSYLGYNETRQYNANLQLTRLSASTGVSVATDFEYRFSATQNNGKITQMKDWVTGEEVTYAYDALNRLASAVTTGPEWGQSYAFDGFGNLLSQTVIKGTAPMMSVIVDPLTNRVVGTSYDANGNNTSVGSYDIENRLISANGATYGYAPDNKRVWKKPDANPANEEFYFWAGNQRLGTYKSTNPGTAGFTTASTNLYFGARLIQAAGTAILVDRLGSNVTGGKRYFPFGQEKPSATANNVEKFTGYYRDAETGLDYADQRYHNPGTGRFLTADPIGDGLNWYAYADGDPINVVDPTGLLSQHYVICPAYWRLTTMRQEECDDLLEREGRPLDYQGRDPNLGMDQGPMLPPPEPDLEGIWFGQVYTVLWPLIEAGLVSSWGGDYGSQTVRLQLTPLGAALGVGAVVWCRANPEACSLVIAGTITSLYVAWTNLQQLVDHVFESRTTGAFPTVEDIRKNCTLVSSTTVPSTRRGNRGGTSTEEVYNCPTGTYTIHTVRGSNGGIIDEHVRPGTTKYGTQLGLPFPPGPGQNR
jgi:RHS repeat-associated protein